MKKAAPRGAAFLGAYSWSFLRRWHGAWLGCGDLEAGDEVR